MDIKILQKIPNKPGIYLFKDKKDNVLYIGKAKNLKNRVSQYFNPNSVWKQDMLNKAIDIDFLQVKTESEALYLEDNLIKKYQPPFNNMLKGSNSYAYIKITNEDFPQIFVTRNKINDGSIYIGPKHNTRDLKDFLQYLRYVFKRRACKKTEFNKGKLCSDYYFGLCSGWCVANSLTEFSSKENREKLKKFGKLAFTNKKEAIKEYGKIIKIVEQFFKGNTKLVEKEIKKQIDLASKNQNFEWAAKLRDIYLKIELLVEQQTVVLSKNVYGYFCQLQEISNWFVYVIINFYEGKIIDVVINKQNKEDVDISSLKSILEIELGELKEENIGDKILFFNKTVKLNKKNQNEIISLVNGFLESYLILESFKDENLLNDLLLELQKRYKLKNFPYHLECIDISHFSGSQTSGGLSAFVGGVANYHLYRRYKIEHTIQSGDDYGALKELISKRFENKLNWPDLFVIDGGKGQLGILKEFMKNPGFKNIFEQVDFIAIGKGSARNTSGKLKGEKEKIFYFDDNLKIKTIDLKYDQSDQILIKLRDEAHRFANAYRKKREAKL